VDFVAAPRPSPDGTHLAFIGHIEGKPYITVYDLATQKMRPVMSGLGKGNFTVRWCRFKSDERLLCSFYGVKRDFGSPYGTTRLLALNLDGSKVTALYQEGRTGGAQYQDRILHWLPDDPRHVIIQSDPDQDVYPSVYKLDIYTGLMQLVQGQREPVLSWMTDREGVVRFGFGFKSNETAGVYITRTGAGATWQVLERFQRYDDERFSPLGFGVLANTMLVSAPNGGRSAVWSFDLDGDKDAQLVYANPEVDVEDAITWPATDQIIGFSYETDRPQTYYIDDHARQIDLAVRKVLPDRATAIIGSTRDGTKLLIAARSDVKPGAYYLLDLKANSLTIVGASNSKLEQAVLAPMKPVSIMSGDVKIPGYLTVPVGQEAKNLPTVIMPHGGPYGRDSWGYDPLVQMMANRGYAVLQMNFRGSTGYGRAWFEAGWKGWGTVIPEDITAGARWIIKEGIADPKRMCIVGWSYGGYAALLSVEKQPDLYRCAVSIAGVSDLNQLKSQERFFYGGAVSMRESVGANKAELKEISPLQHADLVKVPVLLVHGKDDYTVLYSHSTTMAKELQRNHVPTELVLIEGGDHQLARQDMRLTLLTKLEAFLAANLAVK
ncbi:MAG: S9 family peptidase, partial [Gammaproteobacteria bacterium]